MRSSQFFIATQKETPADAEVISHQYMLRAGLIRQLASGLYTWLPLGLSVLRKVEQIVREELNRVGALEVLMPMVQPADLWQESGRWQDYGPELLRLNDRHQRDFVLGPTHEEVISELVRKEVNSYKQLPLTLYQIQTKFRDEVRPRFGIMRGREFIMKDAYSFHTSTESLAETYEQIFTAYCRIFDRLGLSYRAVIADTGSIGGAVSHEFHVLADSGEDTIVFSDGSDYAANIEKAEALSPIIQKAEPTQDKVLVPTPHCRTIEEGSAALNLPTSAVLKTLVVNGSEINSKGQPQLIAIMLRGDHDLNEIKAEQHALIATPLTLADPEQILAEIGATPGSLGPCDLTIPVLVDRSAAVLSDFACGANQTDHHYIGVNWLKDTPDFEVVDLRNVQAGDPSPCGQGTLQVKRGIEVGHIFQLGTKYSQALNVGVLNEQGKQTLLQMGCYGIGITRIVAAAIEQHHDDKGILWPAALTPFQVALIPMNLHKSHRIAPVVEQIYQQLTELGISVLFDDRKERPGVMFKDMELMGIPHQIIIGERNLDQQQVEYKSRDGQQQQLIAIDEAVNFITSLLA